MTIAGTERAGGSRVRFPAGMQRELNRRLKLDLLITAGNAAAGKATGLDPAHTLLNLHFVIPTPCHLSSS